METLALLKEKGFKQAIITNKETRYTEKIIAAHGLGQYMDMVIWPYSSIHRKSNIL
ncbi:HAD family hydrolase [uncultured Agitococcus sp.]|uniref:HAD family hydrolase n=1 Tax=uncultured Agitococcus sp. TaxID=1506599 RepID=UPI00345C1781